VTKSAPDSPGPWIAPRWLLFVLGVFCLVLPAVVWANLLHTPSDWARMSKVPPATNESGIYVESLSGTIELQTGDLVIAVQGKPMLAWAEALWHPVSWISEWKLGETIPYSVIRKGQQLEVPVQLDKQPVQAILSRNWSVLLFTLVFQLLAIFIIIQKPDDPAAQSFFLWGMTTSHFYIWSSFLQIYYFVSGYGFWLYISAASLLWFRAGLRVCISR
jgi:hypothetical protein